MQKKNKSKSIRLSKNVIPIEYDLEIKPDLENFTFEGVETITLSLLKATKVLALHSRDLEIETAEVRLPQDKVFAKISYNEKAETAIFLFPESIPKGKIKLTLVFKGILNDKMRGFYRSRYTAEGKSRHMAITQFEATDARRAFPCFDEPAHKAVFHISLIARKGKTAISNTLPVAVAEHDGEYEIVKFAPTPKMSTYLLAFIVGDFEYLETYTKNRVRVRVYTTPGKKHQARFALDCAAKTLEFYEKYFDIPYPLPVLDMIAIPDFTSGAMENWGAITYRESAILVDEKHSSLGNRQWVALVIAHEIAHQWFGNLVTMEWWTHLWLSEGFASYIEYLAVDRLFPKWDIWTQFANNEMNAALRLDALLHTHPIEIPVHHPNEIGEIFDEVSYSKGASIIRMLSEYLGEKDFRNGLRHYLKKHSYRNTETIHLWQAFAKISKKSVASIMRHWTGKPGYPVVRAELRGENLLLSQERFFASPISKKKAKDQTIWPIPISVKNQNSIQKHFLSRNQQKIVSKREWLKINFGESGFFRTAYSKELLQKLQLPVEKKLLPPLERLGIIRDLFALAEAGIIPTTKVLQFLPSYKKEDNYTVWLEIALGLGRLEQILAKTKTKPKLDQFVLELFSPLAKRLGWNPKKGERHTDVLLRSLAIARAGRSGDKKIIGRAREKILAKEKGKILNPDIRGAVYAIIAQNGGMKESRTFIRQYKKETLHEEKNRIGNGLGEFRDPRILKMACEFSVGGHVRAQDTIGILSSVALNPFGRDAWWNFVRKNWKMLVSRYGDGGHTLARLVKSIGGSAEARHFKSFKKFFAAHDAPGAERAIQQVQERLQGNIAWLERDRKKVENFLNNL